MSEDSKAWQQRTELLLGKDKTDRLSQAHVLVVGLGGVGAYAAEMICRAGVGRMTIVDADTVQPSNINRQLPATHSSLGRQKAEVLAERFLDINPELQLTVLPVYLKDEAIPELLDSAKFDFVVDAIDTVSGKIALVMQAKEHNTPIICSMGAGNKMDPTAFEVSDIYKTSVDPLARVMRYELKKRKVRKLKVVYSKEIPIKPMEDTENSCKHHCICPPGTERKCTARRQVPGSNAFVPSTVGLIIAGEVIKDLIKK